MLNRQAKLKQLGEKLASFPSDWYRKYVVIQKQRTKGSSPALGSVRVIDIFSNQRWKYLETVLE